MRKARNIAFILCACAFLFVTLGNILAGNLLPGYSQRSRSYLEGRAYQTFPQLDVQSVSSGLFQSEFEQYMADSVPRRDGLMLVNATWQRETIELANMPYGFSVYPTFFSSDYLHVPQWGAVTEMPAKATRATLAILDQSAASFESFMERHDDVRWAFALVDRPRNTLASPAYGYVDHSLNYRTMFKAYEKALSKECELVDLSYKDTTQFFEDYFKTDHHWQIQGAVKAYEKICKVFDKKGAQIDGYRVVYDGPFFGSEARSGLITEESDILYDAVFDHSNVSVISEDEEQDQDFLDEGYADSEYQYEKSHKFDNVYADYFHADLPLLVITNESISDDSSLLIIGDSYSNNMERFFAENYHTVYVIDLRFFEESIDDFFDSHSIDDAVVICSSIVALDTSILEKLG